MLQDGRSPVRVPDEVDFFNLPYPSSRTMALGLTQPLTEMSTRNLPGGKKWLACRAGEYQDLPGGKKWPVCKDDNLATIYEPNV
jgi:hypothetical protein